MAIISNVVVIVRYLPSSSFHMLYNFKLGVVILSILILLNTSQVPNRARRKENNHMVEMDQGCLT